MRIACLGWGSLMWKPGVLPAQLPWRHDGPALPIDFARVGDGGELAAVICPTAPFTKVMWTVLSTGSLAEAREFLRAREQIPSHQPWLVGDTVTCDPSQRFRAQIAKWARRRDIDAVVWTALPPRFDGDINRAPSEKEAVEYLAALPAGKAAHAELYIRSAPRFISTGIREAIEQQLGWYPYESAARDCRYLKGGCAAVTSCSDVSPIMRKAVSN